MAKNLTARDIMKSSFLRLGAAHTLREALGILLDPQAQNAGPRALIILNTDGSFAGMLSTRNLLQAMLPDWLDTDTTSPDAPEFERRLLEAMQEKMDSAVMQAMDRTVPAISPDERLPRLIELMQEMRLDCVPVIEQERVVGVVYVTDLFNAAAQLALTSYGEEKK